MATPTDKTYKEQEILNRVFNIDYSAFDIVLKSSVLPSGAATSANQTTLNTYLSPLTTWVTTAVTLTSADTAYKLPSSEQSGRKVIVIYNVSTASIFIGSSSVTTTTGVLLPAGGVMTLDAESNVYGVCSQSGKILNILEGK